MFPAHAQILVTIRLRDKARRQPVGDIPRALKYLGAPAQPCPISPPLYMVRVVAGMWLLVGAQLQV